MRDISGAEFRFAKTLTLPFFGSGMVDLPPGGFKRSKNARKMQMVFFMFYGRVTVEVGTPTKRFSIGKGGMWQVPRGTFPSHCLLPCCLLPPSRGKRMRSLGGSPQLFCRSLIFASKSNLDFGLCAKPSVAPQEAASLRRVTLVVGHRRAISTNASFSGRVSAALPFYLRCDVIRSGAQKLTTISAGNFYAISNPSNTPARIFFAQGNEVIAGTAGGDVSS